MLPQYNLDYENEHTSRESLDLAFLEPIAATWEI